MNDLLAGLIAEVVGEQITRIECKTNELLNSIDQFADMVEVLTDRIEQLEERVRSLEADFLP